MKNLMVVLVMFLTISVSAQATEKKSFEGSVVEAGLTKKETKKVLALNQEKVKEIKAIKNQKFGKEEEKLKIKELKKTTSDKIKAIVGKEKFKKMMAYWKKK